jgi:DGQHR domain-containing protein
MTHTLKLPAIEVRQSPGHRLYTFAVDGKLVHQFATVSRIKRESSGRLDGYQRPEVLSHIAEIRNYLESKSPMVPNAIVLAFDSRVKFTPSAASADTKYARPGVLEIPIRDETRDEDKPGFVVDGQQRLAAVRESPLPQFPLCVTAFITNDVGMQTEQFILVNSTKPLPKGLIYELLPSTQAQLPTLLHRRRFPAYLLDRLNRDEASPFKGLIQTPTNPDGIVKDNSVLRMLENSLSDGALYRYRGDRPDRGDVGRMLDVLGFYWSAVRTVFSAAWGLPPKKSRLMHGAGIVSLGFLMDAIADRYRHAKSLGASHFEKDLRPLQRMCRWTDGYWNFGPGQQRKWNELQNTSKDIELLSNYLLVNYKGKVWAAA